MAWFLLCLPFLYVSASGTDTTSSSSLCLLNSSHTALTVLWTCHALLWHLPSYRNYLCQECPSAFLPFSAAENMSLSCKTHLRYSLSEIFAHSQIEVFVPHWALPYPSGQISIIAFATYAFYCNNQLTWLPNPHLLHSHPQAVDLRQLIIFVSLAQSTEDK